MNFLCDTRSELLERLPKQSIGVEIGVWRGDFSSEILRIVCPAKLHLVDPWVHLPPDEFKDGMNLPDARQRRFYKRTLRRFAEAITAGQVVVHRMRSSEAVSLFEDGYFDWVYVDGNHGYPWALKDMQDYWPKIRPGGYLMGHDCLNVGECAVLQAVEQFCQEHTDDAVWQGVTREHPSKQGRLNDTPTFLVTKEG